MSSQATVGVDLSGGLDKVMHFGAYLVLGFLLSFGSRHLRYPVALAVALGLIYGATDEFHQSLVPGRSAELADWIADGLGTCAGVLLFLLASRIRQAFRTELHAPGAEHTTT